MNYVVHYCKNRNCNNAWIDKDVTNAKTRPPQWKYCRKCCEKMGIAFDSQIPPRRESKNTLQGGVNTPKIVENGRLGIIYSKIVNLFKNVQIQQYRRIL